MGRAIALFCGISITFPSPVIFYELQSSTDVVRAGFQKKETKKKKKGRRKGGNRGGKGKEIVVAT